MKEQEFEHLFKTYYTLLFGVAYDMLHEEEESHDAVHEVFANIWAKGSLPQPAAEKQFLTRSIHNHCVNLIARKERSEKLQKLYPLELSMMQHDRLREERLRQIEQFIEQQLPEETRQVLRLCFEQEKTYAEAATMMKRSVSYINKHIVKALRLLRDHFQTKQE